MPMFDLQDAAGVLGVNARRRPSAPLHPADGLRLTRGRVHRDELHRQPPGHEPGFGWCARRVTSARSMRYAVQRPEGERAPPAMVTTAAGPGAAMFRIASLRPSCRPTSPAWATRARRHRRRRLDPLRRDGQPLRAEPDHRPMVAQALLHYARAPTAAGAAGRAPDGRAGRRAGAAFADAGADLISFHPTPRAVRPHAAAHPRAGKPAWRSTRPRRWTCWSGDRQGRPGADHERQPRLRRPDLHRLRKIEQARADRPPAGATSGCRSTAASRCDNIDPRGRRRRRHLRGRQRHLRPARLPPGDRRCAALPGCHASNAWPQARPPERAAATMSGRSAVVSAGPVAPGATRRPRSSAATASPRRGWCVLADPVEPVLDVLDATWSAWRR